MAADQQQYLDTFNIALGQSGVPVVQRLNAAGGYTELPVTPGTINVYTADAIDANTANSVLDSYQSFLNGIDLSRCGLTDAQDGQNAIATATSQIQTARSTLAPSDRIAAAEAVGSVLHLLPQLYQNKAPTFSPFGMFFMGYGIGVLAPHPIDREPKPKSKGPCTTQGATMRRIAAAAIMQNGMSTANAPGGGTNSCAWAVEHALYNATGMYFVGGGGNTNWVPDVTKGLIGSGWTVVPPGQNPRPGDIGVQNGWGDGGTPANQTSYENHIGIVVTNPKDGNLAIMNNSSGSQAFVNFDESLAFAGYYPAPQDGPPKFYRVPPGGIAQQICLGP